MRFTIVSHEWTANDRVRERLLILSRGIIRVLINNALSNHTLHHHGALRRLSLLWAIHRRVVASRRVLACGSELRLMLHPVRSVCWRARVKIGGISLYGLRRVRTVARLASCEERTVLHMLTGSEVRKCLLNVLANFGSHAGAREYSTILRMMRAAVGKCR